MALSTSDVDAFSLYKRLIRWLADNQGEEPPTFGEKSDTSSDATNEHAFTIPIPGMNGAVDSKFLSGTKFNVIGRFVEIDANESVANAAVKSLIESFGGEVTVQISKSTSACELHFTFLNS